MDYSFNLYNKLAPDGICLALKKSTPEGASPVILCIGSDLSVGDSLGPVTGTKLKQQLAGLNCYVYGTLAKPITAHEVKYMNDFLRLTHPASPIIAIDAAVGNAGDIGLIRVAGRGIIAEQSVFNYSLFSATRLNVVYKMSEIIADGVTSFVLDYLRNMPYRADLLNASLL